MTALRNFTSITEKNIKICIFIAHYSRIPKKQLMYGIPILQIKKNETQRQEKTSPPRKLTAFYKKQVLPLMHPKTTFH